MAKIKRRRITPSEIETTKKTVADQYPGSRKARSRYVVVSEARKAIKAGKTRIVKGKSKARGK